MLGHVWEWCYDGHRTYEAGTVRDPVGPTAAGARRALRGGGWVDAARNVRAALRHGLRPGLRDAGLGFRAASSEENGK